MALHDDIETLKTIDLFSVFEYDALRQLLAGAEVQRLRAGDRLFRRDETSDGGYVLFSGSVALKSEDDSAPAKEILRPVALIGETALIARTRRPIGAITREPSVLLKITRPVFHRVLEAHPFTAARVRALFRSRLMAVSEGLKTGAE